MTFIALLLLLAAPPDAVVTRLDKMARLLELEDRRDVGRGELDRYLHDADAGVRRRAALAAGRIGDAILAPSLVELMNDAEPEVRQMAAFALGLVGDPMAVDRLRAALEDPEGVVRGRAAEALGRIGGAGVAAAVARLVVDSIPPGPRPLTVRGDDPGALTDPWLPLRLSLFALARLKDATAAEAALLDAGQPRFDWWVATYVAMRVESPRLRPVLTAAAAATDPRSRALAARGLGALADASALDLLGVLVRDDDEGVVVQALRALAALPDARATALVVPRLSAKSGVVAWEALRALARLPPDRALRPTVAALVGDERPWIRAAAFPVLARLDREEFALVLSGLDPDPVWWVRGALAGALAEAGDEVAVSVLLSALKDPDARVLPAVLDALRAARAGDAVDTLRRHLAHEDFAVRAAAAEGLAALGARGLAAALVTAYERGKDDADPDARLAALEALAVQDDAGAWKALGSAASNDPARVVRARAAVVLRAAGREAPAPGPHAIERPAFDYREAMAPYDPSRTAGLFTPRARVHTSRGVIEIHLNVVEAPLASAAFLDLARQGFYDGLTFHRVVPDFVVQGGDPRGDGRGGPGYTLRDEVGQRPYGRGAVGLALAGKDTGGSQFFITLSPQPHLEGSYTLLGWVAEGMEVAEAIRPGDAIRTIEVWTGR
ncbi:MAG TPA: HEAT repeat domain-containing protein [Vicinamibacteria bacterium]|nr:HEAT repeat domain-containing protein [Vicinamibacteria bacterium]